MKWERREKLIAVVVIVIILFFIFMIFYVINKMKEDFKDCSDYIIKRAIKSGDMLDIELAKNQADILGVNISSCFNVTK